MNGLERRVREAELQERGRSLRAGPMGAPLWPTVFPQARGETWPRGGRWELWSPADLACHGLQTLSPPLVHGTIRIPKPLGFLARKPVFPSSSEISCNPLPLRVRDSGEFSRISPPTRSHLGMVSAFIYSPSSHWYGLRQDPLKLFPTRPLGSSRPCSRGPMCLPIALFPAPHTLSSP